MVLLDTDVFVIDRFFRRDQRYEVNRQLVDIPRKDINGDFLGESWASRARREGAE